MREFVSRGYRLLVGISPNGAEAAEERAAIGRRLRGVARRPGAIQAPINRSSGAGLGLMFGSRVGPR